MFGVKFLPTSFGFCHGPPVIFLLSLYTPHSAFLLRLIFQVALTFSALKRDKENKAALNSFLGTKKIDNVLLVCNAPFSTQENLQLSHTGGSYKFQLQ